MSIPKDLHQHPANTYTDTTNLASAAKEMHYETVLREMRRCRIFSAPTISETLPRALPVSGSAVARLILHRFGVVPQAYTRDREYPRWRNEPLLTRIILAGWPSATYRPETDSLC